MSKRWCLGETCLSVMVLLAEKTCQISNIPKSKVIRAEALSCRDIARRWDGLEAAGPTGSSLSPTASSSVTCRNYLCSGS